LKSCGGKAARAVSQNGNNSTVIYRRYKIDGDAADTTAATGQAVRSPRHSSSIAMIAANAL